METALFSFIGCFAAMLALAEVTASNKLLRYVGAFLVGLVATIVLGFAYGWLKAHF